MSLIDDYLARGGIIHKAPTAYAAPTLQARELSPAHRQALREHADALEQARVIRLPKRKELRHGKEQGNGSAADLQIQRQDHRETGGADTNKEPQEAEKILRHKAGPEVNLSGLGTTRIISTGNGELIEKFRFAGLEMIFRSDKSGVHLQRFVNNKPIGPSIQLAERSHG